MGNRCCQGICGSSADVEDVGDVIDDVVFTIETKASLNKITFINIQYCCPRGPIVAQLATA